MTLLLLLKPHPRRFGGQRLVIQKTPSRETQREEVVSRVEVAKVVEVDPWEAISQTPPPWVKEPATVTVDFPSMVAQAAGEGLGLEDMILLYMMTER